MTTTTQKEEYKLEEVAEILGLDKPRRLYTYVKSHNVPYYKKPFERPRMYFSRETVDWLREIRASTQQFGTPNRADKSYQPEAGPMVNLAS